VGTVARPAPRAAFWKPPPGVEIIKNTTGQGDWVEKYYDKGWKYKYPVEVRAANDAAKFQQNLIFGRALPKIRAQYTKDLGGDDRRAIVALIVALMDQAFFRVGTIDTDDADVYGATTLRKRHLTFQGHEAHFDFFGKHHQEQHKVILDPTLFAMLKSLRAACKSKHDRLFRFEGSPISAREVNNYLSEFGATAKMFRTYHATRLAREKLLAHKGAEIKERKKIVTQVVKDVAEMIGHEPATCRGSYIDPRVIEAFMEGKLR
jgi:DNA topoisomerase I